MRILKQNNIRLLLVGILLVVSSCKTGKVATGSLAGMSSSEVFRSILDHSPQYTTLSGKLKVTIDFPGNKLSSGASIKMIRDKEIQLSFQYFGFEVFFFDLTPDSIIVVNKYHKWYAAESITNLSRQTTFDFNFNNLQALLSNQLFLAGKNSLSPSDQKHFEIQHSPEASLIRSKDNQGLQYLFTGNFQHKIQSLQIVSGEGGSQAALLSEYSDFQDIANGQLFPMSQLFSWGNATGKAYKLDFSYSKVELNKELDMRFKIPGKLQRMRLENVLKMTKGIE